MVIKELTTDVLVVGAGLAGTLFALELAKKRSDLKIILLNKKEKEQSSSFLAQGGIAAAFPEAGDSTNRHLADTFEASCHSCNKDVAAWFVSNAPEAIRCLEQWGASFDSGPDGSRAFALEGGHSASRVLHHKDSTGRHIIEKLHASLSHYHGISLLEDVQVLELQQTFFAGAVKGALCWDAARGRAISIKSKAVVLATGGLGSLYAYSTNPATATGEGVYLAAKAGAKVKDLAYIQFHPTALWQPSGNRLPLISEAVRGAGALLRNEQGERFMQGQHPLQELAPRDVVARCISREILQQELPYVYLDATGLEKKEWENHFPGIYEICKKAGIDPARQWIPVVPAAHYSCGGIATSVKGHTSVDNLFVIGESACTGLHGANRLASNSLLEATLMAGSLAGQLASSLAPSLFEAPGFREWQITDDKEAEATAEYFIREIKSIVQYGCGIIKTTHDMQEAYVQLQELKTQINRKITGQSLQYYRLNMVLKTGQMLIKSALEQTENIGVFYNSDFEKEYLKAG